MSRAAALALLPALLAPLPGPAAAMPASVRAPGEGAATAPDSRAGALAADLAALRAADHRLLAIGWRLVTGNAPYCEQTWPSVGLLMQDTAAFAEPAAVSAALGIEGPVAVQAVAPGSPAAAAGLAPGDEIVAIGDLPVSAIEAAPARDWRRLARLHEAIERALVRDGSVALTLRDGTVLDLAGVPACRSRFEVIAGKRAVADGRRVIVGRDFPAFGYDEEELAAVVAHELAHNLLAHRVWLDSRGRKRRDVRLSEREADRLIPWLLANAGYDPRAGVRFMQRWGPRHGGGLFRKRTHDGWDERVEAIEAEAALLDRLAAAPGAADWSRHFRRDTTSGGGGIYAAASADSSSR